MSPGDVNVHGKKMYLYFLTLLSSKNILHGSFQKWLGHIRYLLNLFVGDMYRECELFLPLLLLTQQLNKPMDPDLNPHPMKFLAGSGPLIFNADPIDCMFSWIHPIFRDKNVIRMRLKIES
jgi:hypothetical protein